jgi:multiple sugar transport system permease protein
MRFSKYSTLLKGMAAMAISASAPPKADNTMRSARFKEGIAGYLFITPAFLVFLFFSIIPIFIALYLSFTNWNATTPLREDGAFEWVGTENYQELLLEDGRRQERFFNAVKNTTYYVLGVVPTQTLIALILAVILNQRWLKGRGAFRTIFYFPSITSSVVISIVFLWLFATDGLVNGFLNLVVPNFENIRWTQDSTGLIHWFLDKALGIQRNDLGDWTGQQILGLRAWEWISGPSVTMFMIMILNTWTTIGTMMIIFLAALQNIPAHIYEAAEMDGATSGQIFRRIIIPMLRPTTFFVLTLGLIGTFQVFDQVYIIGGGNATMTIAVLVHRNAFGDNPNMGLATATAIVLFVIIFAFTLIQRRLLGGERGEA